jgi:hypothetical protein
MSDLNLTEIGTGESIINYTDHNTNYSSIETTVNNHMNDVSDFHNASGIVNDSGVTGANVDDALDELEDQIEAISSSANALIGAFSVTASGTNTYTGTFVDLTYFTDLKVLVTIPNSNTSQTVTLNINALGAKSIKYYDNDGNKQDPSIGMLKQNKSYLVQYDGTDFVLLTNAQAEIEAIEDRGVPFPIDEWIGEGTKTIWANNRDGTWEDNRWDGTAGVYSPNVLEVKVGNYGAKLTTSTNYGGIHIVKTLNLTEFEDGTASTTSDKIQLAIYTPSASYANLDTNGVNIVFANNAYTDSTDHFYYFVTKTNLTNGGWSYHEIAKSAFSEIGSPDWASVTGFSLDARATLGGEVNITIDAIQMVSASGAFQRAGSADYTINSGTWYVGWDEAYKSNVVRNLADPTSDKDALVGTKAYSNKFEVEANVIINDAGLDSYGYGWYSDDDNMMTAQLITSTTFRLNVVDSTGSNTFDVTVPAVVVGQLLNMRIVRNSASVIAILNTNGDTYSVIGDTDSTGDGYSTVRDRTECDPADTILDFGITTTERASQAGWSAKTDDITSRKQGNNLDNALSQMEGEGLTEAFREWNYLHNTNTHNDLYFQDYTVFTSGAGTLSNDPTNTYWGDNSVKLLNNDNGASTMYFDLESTTLDFTKSINGESIDDNGYIIVKLFLSDQAMTTSVVLTLSTGATIDANSKQYTITGLATGNNYVAVKKSAFVTNNNGAWSGLQSIRFQYPTNAGYQNEYVSFQLVQLVRVDPDDSTQYSYFQKQIADGVYQNTITWAGNSEFILGIENGRYRFKDLGTATDIDSLLFGKKYPSSNDFIATTTITLSNAGETSLFGWVDTNNYIRVRMNSGSVDYQYNIGGSVTTNTDTLSTSIGDTLTFVIEKTNNVASLQVYKNGVIQPLDISSHTLAFSGLDGCLFIGSLSGNDCYIESATITSTKVANFANTSQNSKFLDNGILPYITTFTFGTATPITNIVTNFRYSVSEQGICKGWAYYKADDGQNASSLTISLPVAPKNNGNTNMPCVSQEKVNATWTNPLAYIDDSGSIIEFRSFSTATTGQAFIISVFFEYEIE